MPQSAGSGKRLIIILSLGGALALALTAAHYYSPVSLRLSANEDVELVLLHAERPMLFVYRPAAATVSAIRLPKKMTRGAGSAVQRAHSALTLVLKRGFGVQDTAHYIEVAEPELERFYEFLNGWRSRPADLLAAAAWLRELKRAEGTNLSWHDLLLLALELSRLNSSSFVIADLPKDYFDKAGGGGEPVPGETAAAQPESVPARLEVLNASGKKDLAERVARYLRKKGFDVINYSTYKAVEKQTKIVNCSGNIAAARLAREALGLKDLKIYSEPKKSAVVQARVILGTDFDAAKVRDPALIENGGGR